MVWIVNDSAVNGNESGTSFEQALFFKKIGFNLLDTMIYRKKNGAVGSRYTYLQEFEYMFVFSKNYPKTVNFIRDRKNVETSNRTIPVTKSTESGRGTKRKSYTPSEYGRRKNIWEYAVGLGGGGGTTNDKDAFKHPAMFPEKLAEDHIISWSNPGDTILDPMMGAGTVGKMAVLNNRHFIGIEVSQEYYDIAKNRIERVMKNGKLD